MNAVSIVDRLKVYQLFCALFFDLPDYAFVDMLKQLPIDDLEGSEGSTLLVRYLESIQGRSDEEVLRDLRVDRTHLMLGAVDDGIPAPFESAYLNLPVQRVLSDLNSLYRGEEYGFADSRSEQSDHIAKELGFMQMYCEREMEAKNDTDVQVLRECERQFYSDHLGRWIRLFSAMLKEHAQTDFYRSAALMLDEFADAEEELLRLS